MAPRKPDLRWTAKVRASATFFLAGAVAGMGLYFANLAYIKAGNKAAPPAPRLLGAPDFNGYCRATGQGPVKLITSYAAYGWHCSAGNGTGDDATAVCAWTYGLSTGQVISSVSDFNNPYTWQCLRITGILAPPDFNGYCQAIGHGAVRFTGGTAYGWHCRNGSGIDADMACEWTNHVPVAVGRFQDFYDPNSWQCWE